MEILYFEPTDEVTRAIERIREVKDADVALVLPQNSLILQSIVNLKLIKRISQQAGKQITLVTTDQIGRNLAGQIGLTVYGKIEDGRPVGKVFTKTPEPVTSGALREKILQDTEEMTTVTGIQVHRYDKDDPLVRLGDLAEKGMETGSAPTEEVAAPTRATLVGETPPRKRRRWRRLFFILLLLLAAWLYFVTYFAATRVLLTVKGEAATVDVEVSAVGNPGPDQVKLLSYASEQSATKEVAATGTKNLGNKAKGTVSLVNSYSSASQTIPAGSTLSDSKGQTFTLAQAVTIPGAEFAVEGSAITVKKPGKVDGNIEATTPGESYNINGGQMKIAGITEQRDNKVYGENPATSGGTTLNKKVVTDTDLAGLQTSLIAELTAKATAETAKQAPSDLMPIGELGKTETVSYQASATAGAEADKITGTGKVSVRLAGVAKADLTSFANRQTVANRPNQTFTATKDPTISVLSADAGAPLARLRLVVEGNVSAKIDTEALKKDLVGKREAAARERLEQVPLYASVQFRYAPSWLKGKVSRRLNRVSVEVLYE